jgi:beta-mannosidase
MWSTEPQVDIDDWHWTTQLNQARAVAFGIAHFRSHYPLNRGIVMWSLNDNWPVISWAAVDAHNIRKPLWYALRSVYADRFMTIQPRTEQGAERPTVLLHNDSAGPWHGEVIVSRRRTVGGGGPLRQQQVSFDLEPRSATSIVINDDVLSPINRSAEYLVAQEASVAAAYWYFVEDPQLQLAMPDDSMTVDVERSGSGYSVAVFASSLVKDLALFPDRLDPNARVDTALVSLQAGESHTFRVSSNRAELDVRALASKPVLRSVNDLIKR